MDSRKPEPEGVAPLPPLQPLARGTLAALVAIKLAVHLPYWN